MEGQQNRREETVIWHYYHTFRRDYRNRRFTGYKRPTQELTTFIRMEFQRYLTGELESERQFLTR